MELWRLVFLDFLYTAEGAEANLEGFVTFVAAVLMLCTAEAYVCTEDTGNTGCHFEESAADNGTSRCEVLGE